MPDGASHSDKLITASEFFSRARERLTFDVPVGLADPHVIPRHDQDDDPAVTAAIASVRPIRPAAVLVPIIERGEELSVLFTQRTAHLTDHAGDSFPGGKIDAQPPPRCVRRRRRSHLLAALSTRSAISTFT